MTKMSPARGIYDIHYVLFMKKNGLTHVAKLREALHQFGTERHTLRPTACKYTFLNVSTVALLRCVFVRLINKLMEFDSPLLIDLYIKTLTIISLLFYRQSRRLLIWRTRSAG